MFRWPRGKQRRNTNSGLKLAISHTCGRTHTHAVVFKEKLNNGEFGGRWHKFIGLLRDCDGKMESGRGLWEVSAREQYAKTSVLIGRLQSSGQPASRLAALCFAHWIQVPITSNQVVSVSNISLHCSLCSGWPKKEFPNERDRDA